MTFPNVPKPDAVLERIGRQFPPRVLLAEKQATASLYRFGLSLGPRYEEARQLAQADAAAANKILAAYNPKLIVTLGGLS